MDATASPYYRVSLKTIILDDQARLLLVQQEEGQWEMPGGGWDHDEALEACVKREIQEELGVGVVIDDPAVVCMYTGRGRKNTMRLKIVIRAKLESTNFTIGDDIIDSKYVTRQELANLDMCPEEIGIKQYADVIWP